MDTTDAKAPLVELVDKLTFHLGLLSRITDLGHWSSRLSYSDKARPKNGVAESPSAPSEPTDPVPSTEMNSVCGNRTALHPP